MPIGSEIATFTTTVTSISKSTDAAGNHGYVINVEGKVFGGIVGMVLGTITATTSDLKSGSYTADFSAYLADGGVLAGLGAGVFGLVGGYSWQLNGTGVFTNGARLAHEGVVDLGSHSYNGRLLELT